MDVPEWKAEEQRQVLDEALQEAKAKSTAADSYRVMQEYLGCSR